MRAAFLAVLLVPATGLAKPSAAPDHSLDVADRLRAAMEDGDARAAATQLAVPLAYEGLDASTDACKQLGDAGVVKKKSDLRAFAACLIALVHANGAPVDGEAADAPEPDTFGLHVRVARGARAITRVVFIDAVAGGIEDGIDNGYTAPSAPPPPPPPPPANPPQIVAPNVLDANRIAGEEKILPDAKTRAEIAKSGRTRVIASAKICIDKAGAVTGVSMMKSSGWAAYDDEIRAGMLTWKYRPFMVNGVATAACTAIMFIYTP
jgi:hypothetical protein